MTKRRFILVDDQHAIRVMSSPVGELLLAATEAGLTHVLWEQDHAAECKKHATALQHAVDHLDEAERQLREYFEGIRHAFSLTLVPEGTQFQLAAWEQLQQIPYGETRSYQTQALSMGDRNKSRAVGSANGQNPLSIVVPCHRVITKSGKLGGFAGGLDAKAWLLAHEQNHRSPPS